MCRRGVQPWSTPNLETTLQTNKVNSEELLLFISCLRCPPGAHSRGWHQLVYWQGEFLNALRVSDRCCPTGELPTPGKAQPGPANLVCNQFVPAVLSCHLLPSQRLAFQAISGSR